MSVTPLGHLGPFMDALAGPVSAPGTGLEGRIDTALTVHRWRPVKIDPPAIYNWLTPSPADIPAVGIVRDQLMLAVRIIVSPSDLDEQTAALESYFDSARDVIDADLIEPSQSVLSAAALMCERTTTRSIVDVFNDITYLGWELMLRVQLRRRFV